MARASRSKAKGKRIMGRQSMKAMKANPAGRVEAVDPKDIIKEFDNLCKEGKLVEAQVTSIACVD